MPIVRPFRALRYGSDHWPDLPRLISPSVDGDPLDRDIEGEGHPHRIRRLVRGREGELAGPQDPPYTHAARLLDRWKQDGVLVRDARPAFYPWATRMDGAVRRGVLTLVRIEAADSGPVLPHERIAEDGPSDLDDLLAATELHTGILLMLVPDERGVLEEQSEQPPGHPIFDVVDGRGVAHGIWRDEDPRRHIALLDAIRHEVAVLADGHHRFAAARRLRARLGGGRRESPYDYVPALLLPASGAMVDPAPVRRSARHLPEAAAAFLDALPSADPGAVDLLQAGRPSRTLSLPPGDGPAICRAEDLILAPLRARGVHFDEALHDRLDEGSAATAIERGDIAISLTIPAPTASEVIAAAVGGAILPPRSTRFLPKPAKGLLACPLSSF